MKQYNRMFKQISLGTTAAESMNAAANIFVGMVMLLGCTYCKDYLINDHLIFNRMRLLC